MQGYVHNVMTSNRLSMDKHSILYNYILHSIKLFHSLSNSDYELKT